MKLNIKLLRNIKRRASQTELNSIIGGDERGFLRTLITPAYVFKYWPTSNCLAIFNKQYRTTRSYTQGAMGVYKLKEPLTNLEGWS